MLLVILIPSGVALEKIRSNSSVINPDLSQASCLLVALVAVLGALLQTAQIILRFVNIGAINMTFRIYGIVVNQ